MKIYVKEPSNVTYGGVCKRHKSQKIIRNVFLSLFFCVLHFLSPLPYSRCTLSSFFQCIVPGIILQTSVYLGGTSLLALLSTFPLKCSRSHDSVVRQKDYHAGVGRHLVEPGAPSKTTNQGLESGSPPVRRGRRCSSDD